ncbi:MAG: hypothetical protein IJW51_07470 [Clostridia bacterium]|nr:hypothetical protein [Clostridia bacterium]
MRINKAELRVREYEYYRAAYCGLCRSMGKCTGQCSRLTLSYDISFLTQVRMALLGTVPTFGKRRCAVHPFRARMMMEPNEELFYAADVSALLAYEKCRDDRADRRGVGRLVAAARCFLMRSAYRRAAKRLPELAAFLRERLTALSSLERENRPTVDEPAAIFGEMLAALFSHGLPEELRRIAHVIGTKIGRFIYILDAIDDLEKDQKNRNFNPVLLLYGKEPTEHEKKMLEDALLSCLSDAAAALDLVEEATGSPRRAVLENILYLGMPATAKKIIWGEAKTCQGGHT